MTEFDAADGHVHADHTPAPSTTAAAREKTCSACGETKPTAEFSANASNADALQRHCKVCMRGMKARSRARQEEGGGDEFATLALAAIMPSLTNPRTVFDEAKLAELAESIAASGVHQPILVRPLPANRLDETSRKLGRSQRETHEIVSGERRWRASKQAGKTTIPALVRRMTDAQVLEAQIVENLQRDGLTDLDEAEGYQRLVDQAAVPKEEIGKKIGKSRSYVYQHLKLLELNTAGREALRAGRLDYSKALLIARIPNDKLQIKALGQATGDDNYGRALNVRDLQAWLQTNVMLSLQRTRFDIRDATLREGAGACLACPKRTGADRDLFADVDSPDLCIDPSCYRDKERAHDDRRFEEAQKAGRKVIEQAKAAKLHNEHSRHWLEGYYHLDEAPDYRLEVDGTSLRRALGKHCPEPVLVKHPTTGAVHEVVPIDQAKNLIETHSLTRSAKRLARASGGAKQAQPKPIEERQEYRQRWQTAVLRRTDAFLQRQTSLPPELLRAWLVDRLAGYDSGAFGPALGLGEEFNDPDALVRVQAMPEAELPTLMLRYILWSSEDEYDAWGPEQEQRQGPRTALHELIHMAGVDLNDARAEAKREIEGEERAAAMEAEEAAKASKPAKGKKSTAPPAAGADSTQDKPKGLKAGAKKKAEPKTTAAAARAGIAAALRNAEGDGEQDQAPDGAKLDEGDALASPGQAADAANLEGAALAAQGRTSAPQVGDMIRVTSSEEGWFGFEGIVLQVLARGVLRVRLEDIASTEDLPASTCVEVLSTAPWPFPVQHGGVAE